MKKFVFPAVFAMAVIAGLAFKPSKALDTQFYRIIPGGNPVCDLSPCGPVGSTPCDHSTYATQPLNPAQNCTNQVLNLKFP